MRRKGKTELHKAKDGFEIEVANLKPLSVNKAWQGRRFKSKEYKDFEREVGAIFGRRHNPILGPVSVEYFFHLKNANNTDVDNLIKPLQDMLVKLGYIKDDRQIQRLVATKKKHMIDCVYVSIQEYTELLSTPPL